MARSPKTSRAVNPLRGEVEITLDGEVFGLRPSYEAIIAIEAQTGASIIHLSSMADNMSLPLDKAAIVVTELMRAWGRAAVDGRTSARAANPQRVGELIYDRGLPTVLVTIAVVLKLAASGGYTPAGELKPVMGTTTTAPSTGD